MAKRQRPKRQQGTRKGDKGETTACWTCGKIDCSIVSECGKQNFVCHGMHREVNMRKK